jgi:hypothetical protein
MTSRSGRPSGDAYAKAALWLSLGSDPVAERRRRPLQALRSKTPDALFQYSIANPYEYRCRRISSDAKDLTNHPMLVNCVRRRTGAYDDFRIREEGWTEDKALKRFDWTAETLRASLPQLFESAIGQ